MSLRMSDLKPNDRLSIKKKHWGEEPWVGVVTEASSTRVSIDFEGDGSCADFKASELARMLRNGEIRRLN